MEWNRNNCAKVEVFFNRLFFDTAFEELLLSLLWYWLWMWPLGILYMLIYIFTNGRNHSYLTNVVWIFAVVVWSVEASLDFKLKSISYLQRLDSHIHTKLSLVKFANKFEKVGLNRFCFIRKVADWGKCCVRNHEAWFSSMKEFSIKCKPNWYHKSVKLPFCCNRICRSLVMFCEPE